MLKTDSFLVDYLIEDDAISLSEMMLLNHDNFKRYFPITLSKNKSTVDSLKFIKEKTNQINENFEFTFAIKDILTSKVVGIIIIKEINWELKQGEFAYCMSFEFENKGWMCEAIALTSKYGFEVLGFEKFQIIAHKSNLGSCKVAENCGFKWQKTLMNEYTPPNENPLNMELYELSNKF